MVYDTLSNNHLKNSNDEQMTEIYENFNVDTDKKASATGALLKSIRLKNKMTEDDIYKALKIKARIVHAIENHNYTNLPDTVTVTALVRQYATLLGLDAVKISTAYKNEMMGTDQKIEVVFPDKLPSSFKPYKQSFFVTFILIALYCMWHILNSSENLIPQITPVTDIITNNNIKNDKNLVSDTKTQSINTAILNIEPELHFKIIQQPKILLKASGGKSWIEIKDIDTKRIIYSAILNDGEEYEIPYNQKGLRLKAGNSAVLSLMVNNKLLDILPTKNLVLRNFDISSDSLLKFYNENQNQTVQQ